MCWCIHTAVPSTTSVGIRRPQTALGDNPSMPVGGLKSRLVSPQITTSATANAATPDIAKGVCCIKHLLHLPTNVQLINIISALTVL